MKIISKIEVIDWIFQQPDEKETNISNTYFAEECGCIMQQYGKHIGLEFHNCSMHCWLGTIYGIYVNIAELRGAKYLDFYPPSDLEDEKEVFTFKEIKDHLRKNEQTKNN